MLKTTFTALALTLASIGFVAGGASPAMAYSCEGQFSRANELVTKAESMVKKDTDARILALIAEAKGIANSGIISHRKANERHTGKNGKFMHGDSVRKGKWAQSLAKQAIFLLSGDTM